MRALILASVVGFAALVCGLREARSDQYLVFKLKRAEADCAAGRMSGCAEARDVRYQLASRGWCYGKPSDTLAWQRDKTGWVRCR